MCKFKVGDIVVINPESRYYDIGSLNPANEEGVVIEVFYGTYIVKWGKGRNSYREQDLLLVDDFEGNE